MLVTKPGHHPKPPGRRLASNFNPKPPKNPYTMNEINNQLLSNGVNIFSAETASNILLRESSRSNPGSLWHNLWMEGEVACLFGGSNSGKSILAVQIGRRLADEGKRVLYFDFELSDKQFQMRYTNENGIVAMPDSFIRATINNHGYDPMTFESQLMTQIEVAARALKADVVIVDNLTYLCSASESGDSASRLMISLCDIKRRNGFSMLIIAHTPKRDNTLAITQDDLAGSKKLANFFDSIFAIGVAASDESTRYIKQLKARSVAIEHGASNVMTCDIAMTDDGLQLLSTGHCCESMLLRKHSRQSTDPSGSGSSTPPDDDLATVERLYREGASVSRIMRTTSLSRSKVFALIKQCREQQASVPDDSPTTRLLHLSLEEQ